MTDGVRSLVYFGDRKQVIDGFLYTPDMKLEKDVCVGLSDGESHLRGFEMPGEPIKFLGMMLYPLAAGQFTHLPEGTALSQDGFLHARDGSPLMGFRLSEERLLAMLVDTRSTSPQAVQHQKGLDVFRPAEVRLRLLTACLLGATLYASCRALLSSVYFGCVAPCVASVYKPCTQMMFFYETPMKYLHSHAAPLAVTTRCFRLCAFREALRQHVGHPTDHPRRSLVILVNRSMAICDCPI